MIREMVQAGRQCALLWMHALSTAAGSIATLALGSSCTDRRSCSDHGHCIDLACVCDEGWSGTTCADAVPTPPPTPPAAGRAAARENLEYLLLVFVPILGRFLESWVRELVKASCCKQIFGGNVFKQAMLGSVKDGNADEQLCLYGIPDCKWSWDEALAALSWSPCMGRGVGALRLVFWHWLQPIMYVWSLCAYWDVINSTQQKLGLVVGAREAVYLLLTLVALWKKPIFLLVNLSSPKKKNKSRLLYVFMPEKYVAKCALRDYYWLFLFLIIFVLVADLCGIAALVVGVGDVNGTLPLPLAVGYIWITLGILAFVCLTCWCSPRDADTDVPSAGEQLVRREEGLYDDL